jgi:hypothetical protein
MKKVIPPLARPRTTTPFLVRAGHSKRLALHGHVRLSVLFRHCASQRFHLRAQRHHVMRWVAEIRRGWRAPDGSQVVFTAISGAASAWYRARMVGLAKCDSAAPGLSPESRRSGALAQAANVSSFSSVVGLLCYNKRVALASRGRSELAP